MNAPGFVGALVGDGVGLEVGLFVGNFVGATKAGMRGTVACQYKQQGGKAGMNVLKWPQLFTCQTQNSRIASHSCS